MSYWRCVGMLFVLFIFFRLMVVISLVLQDRNENKQAGGDTRNTDIPDRTKKISSGMGTVKPYSKLATIDAIEEEDN